MNEPTIGKKRLYFIRPGLYVQHNGSDDMPPEIADYMTAHGGEMPPFIPLPAGPVEFALFEGSHKVRWSGRGSLPAVVLDFVAENGVLPHSQDTARAPA
jgi:hypothetical protein